jgi:hypothetical protein
MINANQLKIIRYGFSYIWKINKSGYCCSVWILHSRLSLLLTFGSLAPSQNLPIKASDDLGIK